MRLGVCFAAPVVASFEPVGRWFESRDRHVRLLSGSSGGGAGADSGEEEGEEGSDEEVNPLLLDPTQWKVGRFSLTPNTAHHIPNPLLSRTKTTT